MLREVKVLQVLVQVIISQKTVVEKAIAAPFWGAPLRATFPTAAGPKHFTTPLQP